MIKILKAFVKIFKRKEYRLFRFKGEYVIYKKSLQEYVLCSANFYDITKLKLYYGTENSSDYKNFRITWREYNYPDLMKNGDYIDFKGKLSYKSLKKRNPEFFI